MKNIKWILLFLVVFGFSLLGYKFLYKKTPLQEVTESVIRKGKITIRTLATGTVQPENRLQIKSPVAGRVEQVLVKEGDKIKKGQILAWLSSTERAAMLDAARSQGIAEVKRWEELYKPTPLIAPISGTIIQRNVEPGQTFTVADAVLVMSDRLSVKAQVDETDLAQIKLKQKAEVTLDAYPDRVLPATVDEIAYEAKTVNNVTTYTIDVVPDENIDYMRSGMTANVSFIGDQKEDILLIPNEFIKYENGKPTARVKVREKNQVQELTLGISDGKVTEVTGGLKENDVVLLIQGKKEKSGGNPFSPMGTRGPREGSGGGSRGK